MRSRRTVRGRLEAGSLLHPTRWPLYLGGLLTEMFFIIGLSAIALLIALLAKAVF